MKTLFIFSIKSEPNAERLVQIMFKIQEERTERRYVEKIINKRSFHGRTEYFVVWRGSDETEGTWLPMSRLPSLFRMVRLFQNKLKLRRRQKIQRKIRERRRLTQQDEELVKEQEEPHLKPLFLPPENCISLVSQSEQSLAQGEKMEEEPIMVSRFDCVRGIWVNYSYAASKLREIEELRELFSWRHQADKVKIHNIVRVNRELVVQYERNAMRFQCLLSNFKSYMPKLLIKFMLNQYDPAQHTIKQARNDDEQFAFQDLG